MNTTKRRLACSLSSCHRLLAAQGIAFAALLATGCGGTDQDHQGDDPSGGSSALEGTTGSGGAVSGNLPSGGAISGGTPTGGLGAGGASIGGSGTSMGGLGSGNASGGGTSIGGTGSDVPETGGAASGGEATGGLGMGGTATGGSASGGAAMGGRNGSVSTGGTSGSMSTGGRNSGGSGTGGMTATGGATASGGDSGSGGGNASGGDSGSGGDSQSGGGTASGGDFGTGGDSTDGGATASGGTSGVGGSGGPGSTDGITPITVWLAGDSTVANGSSPCPRGWGMFLDTVFNEHVTVMNLAAGGRSIRSWLYTTLETSSGAWGDGECDVEMDGSGEPILQDRWQQILDGMSPGDYLFIQFGINDTVPTCDYADSNGKTYWGRHVGPVLFRETHGMMAAAALERGAQPIFVTPASNLNCSGSTALRGRGDWPSYVIAAGETYSVPVVDLNQLSVDLYNALALCPLDSATSTTSSGGIFFCDDTTHFSDVGAPQIAQLVLDGLAAQNIGLANYAL